MCSALVHDVIITITTIFLKLLSQAAALLQVVDNINQIVQVVVVEVPRQ